MLDPARQLLVNSLTGDELVSLAGVTNVSKVATAQSIALLRAVGTVWFVDTVNGSDSNDGRSMATAFATMGRAFYTDAIVSGAGTISNLNQNDTILFVGKVKEQLKCPLLTVGGVNVTGVQIIGVAGGHVRDDDAAKWTYPDSGAVAGGALLEMRGDSVGWEFHNFLMTPEPNGSGGACLLFDDGTGHYIVDGMRFVGIDVTTTYGVRAIGSGFNRILNSQFLLCTTGIYGTVGGAGNNWLHVINCEFDQNTNHIIVSSSYGLFQGNIMHQAATQNMNVANAAGGANVVQGNVFPIAAAGILNTGGYKGGATDFWTGNFASDAMAYGVPAAGP